MMTDSAIVVFDPVTDAALSTHFRLSPLNSAPSGPRRAVTADDVRHILTHFGKMRDVLARHDATFKDGTPVDKNGKPVAAASFLDSKEIIFSGLFRNFTDANGVLTGPNSRAAILMHEAFHSVDAAKLSNNDDTHISEFATAYDTQPADKSLFNPSSYASFAAHVQLRRDPSPRFGLGRGRAL
jgi:hypothetical protein